MQLFQNSRYVAEPQTMLMQRIFFTIDHSWKRPKHFILRVTISILDDYGLWNTWNSWNTWNTGIPGIAEIPGISPAVDPSSDPSSSASSFAWPFFFNLNLNNVFFLQKTCLCCLQLAHLQRAQDLKIRQKNNICAEIPPNLFPTSLEEKLSTEKFFVSLKGIVPLIESSFYCTLCLIGIAGQPIVISGQISDRLMTWSDIC